MKQQQGTPKKGIAASAALFLISLAAFSAAFWYFDGMGLIDQLFMGGGSDNAATVEEPTDSEPVTLQLPEGMTEEAALRLWQEQLDSQRNIRRLIDGEVTGFSIDDVRTASASAELDVMVSFADGSRAAGRIGMDRFGANWFFSYVSGMRRDSTGGMADTISAGDGEAPISELPTLEDVDIPLLNTMIAQQIASAEVLEEYATGQVLGITVLGVREGPGTRTLEIEMEEDHEIASGEVLFVSQSVAGEEKWFVVRFTKTGSR